MRLLLLLPLLLCACAPDGCTRMWSAELLLGASMQGTIISTARFDAFLDREVTSRFPDGLTLTEGRGRWRTPEGVATTEPSIRVLLVVPPGTDTMARLNAIREAYKAEFKQRSVGLVVTPSCADF